MSDEKISQLTSGVPAQGADILPIARPSAPGVAYSVTAQVSPIYLPLRLGQQ